MPPRILESSNQLVRPSRVDVQDFWAEFHKIKKERIKNKEFTDAFDDYAMLSPLLLERLRVWWREAHAKGKMLDGGWLFPGQNPINPLSTRQLNRICHAAADAAEIDKRVSMHTLSARTAAPRCGSLTSSWAGNCPVHHLLWALASHDHRRR